MTGPNKEITIVSINDTRRGNRFLDGGTVFMFQNGRDLERYVEEFLDSFHLATCDDVSLKAAIHCAIFVRF